MYRTSKPLSSTVPVSSAPPFHYKNICGSLTRQSRSTSDDILKKLVLTEITVLLIHSIVVCGGCVDNMSGRSLQLLFTCVNPSEGALPAGHVYNTTGDEAR